VVGEEWELLLRVGRQEAVFVDDRKCCGAEVGFSEGYFYIDIARSSTSPTNRDVLRTKEMI
jgi:hypothetical protein